MAIDYSIRTISISTDALLKLASGIPLKPNQFPIGADAKIGKCGFNDKTFEFWMEVHSPDFDDRLKIKRLPTELKLEPIKA